MKNETEESVNTYDEVIKTEVLHLIKKHKLKACVIGVEHSDGHCIQGTADAVSLCYFVGALELQAKKALETAAKV